MSIHEKAEMAINERVAYLLEYPTKGMAEAFGDAWATLSGDEDIAFVEIAIHAISNRLMAGFTRHQYSAENACRRLSDAIIDAARKEADAYVHKCTLNDEEDRAI